MSPKIKIVCSCIGWPGAVFLLLLLNNSVFAQKKLSLEGVLALAKEHSVALKQVATQRETKYWEYRRFQTGLNPQLVLSGNLPTYQKEYAGVYQPDGSILYQPINQVNPTLGLVLEQPLYWSGGKVTANSNLLYFNNLTSRYSQWNNQILNVQISQPLFSFNKFKWERRLQPVIYEESKRTFVEDTEAVSRNVVELFFDVLMQQVHLEIARTNLAYNDTIYRIEQKRFSMGTSSLERLLQVELQLLRSQQEVAEGNLNLETNRLKLASYAGLSRSDVFNLILPDALPIFDIPLHDAIHYAQQNRAQSISFSRRRTELERDVVQAKASRFTSSVTATFGLNKSGSSLESTYAAPLQQQTLNIGLSIPIIDWGRNQAALRSALANKKLHDYIISQEEEDFEQTIITHVLQFGTIRSQVRITNKSDSVAQKRYDVSMNRYMNGKLDLTNLYIALQEKDSAKEQYIEALRDFWIAYFELRRLTLFDFSTNSALIEG